MSIRSVFWKHHTMHLCFAFVCFTFLFFVIVLGCTIAFTKVLTSVYLNSPLPRVLITSSVLVVKAQIPQSFYLHICGCSWIFRHWPKSWSYFKFVLPPGFLTESLCLHSFCVLWTVADTSLSHIASLWGNHMGSTSTSTPNPTTSHLLWYISFELLIMSLKFLLKLASLALLWPS